MTQNQTKKMEDPAGPPMAVMNYLSKVQVWPPRNKTASWWILCLTMLKERFSDDPVTYKQFIKILGDYRTNGNARHLNEVVQSIDLLFRNQPDLIEGFKQFLPAENSQRNQEDKPQVPEAERQLEVSKVFAEYNENPTSLSELYNKLKEFFGDDPATLKLLEQHVPDASSSTRKEAALDAL